MNSSRHIWEGWTVDGIGMSNEEILEDYFKTEE
jgi:hypothetical protein